MWRWALMDRGFGAVHGVGDGNVKPFGRAAAAKEREFGWSGGIPPEREARRLRGICRAVAVAGGGRGGGEDDD
jgi:hypothetical protein